MYKCRYSTAHAALTFLALSSFLVSICSNLLSSPGANAARAPVDFATLLATLLPALELRTPPAALAVPGLLVGRLVVEAFTEPAEVDALTVLVEARTPAASRCKVHIWVD